MEIVILTSDWQSVDYHAAKDYSDGVWQKEQIVTTGCHQEAGDSDSDHDKCRLPSTASDVVPLPQQADAGDDNEAGDEVGIVNRGQLVHREEQEQLA